MVRERLGEPSILRGSSVSSKTKKKRVAATRSRPGTSGGEPVGVGVSDSVADAASVVSAAATYKTKASQPDHTRLPAEYEKVSVRGFPGDGPGVTKVPNDMTASQLPSLYPAHSPLHLTLPHSRSLRQVNRVP